MSTLTQVTEKNFEQEVLRSELPVLIEFGAEWCGPCKTVAPELEALAAELKDQAHIVAVDIDKAPMLAQQFGVQSVPAFAVFAEGRPVGGKVGALTRKQLRELIEPFLKRSAGAIKPEELSALLEEGQALAVDTREAVVFNRARIQGAKNFPLEELEGRLAELMMLGVPAVLYCRAGDKSQEACEKLHQQGVEVAFLEGGVLSWEGAGYELDKG